MQNLAKVGAEFTCMTKGVSDLCKIKPYFARFVGRSLGRYQDCDWGESCSEDSKKNDMAVKNGDDRILAAYICPVDKRKIWIITEWDRSVTTILFPSEY